MTGLARAKRLVLRRLCAFVLFVASPENANASVEYQGDMVFMHGWRMKFMKNFCGIAGLPLTNAANVMSVEMRAVLALDRWFVFIALGLFRWCLSRFSSGRFAD